MNHQIIAAIALGNAMRLLQGSPPEQCAELATISLMQMDRGLSQEDAARYVLNALAEISNIPFSAADVRVEALKLGVDIPIH